MIDSVIRQMLDEVIRLVDHGIMLQRKKMLYVAYSYYHAASVLHGTALRVAMQHGVSEEVQRELLEVETAIRNVTLRAERIEGNGNAELSGRPRSKDSPRDVLEDTMAILDAAGTE